MHGELLLRERRGRKSGRPPGPSPNGGGFPQPQPRRAPAPGTGNVPIHRPPKPLVLPLATATPGFTESPTCSFRCQARCFDQPVTGTGSPCRSASFQTRSVPRIPDQGAQPVDPGDMSMSFRRFALHYRGKTISGVAITSTPACGQACSRLVDSLDRRVADRSVETPCLPGAGVDGNRGKPDTRRVEAPGVSLPPVREEGRR